MKVTYTGDIPVIDIKVGSARFTGWNKGETKEVSEEQAKRLLVQSYFIKEGDEVKPIKEKTTVDLDLNNDGVIDGKDRSIAGKFLRSKKGRE